MLNFNALFFFVLNRFRASPVNDIFCQSLPGSPFKPLTLRQLEQQEEILRVPFRRSKEVGESSNSIFSVLPFRVYRVYINISMISLV